MKRMLILLAVVVAIFVIASVLHFDGEVRPLSPRYTFGIRGSRAWYGQPSIAIDETDPNVVYAIVPALPNGNRFDAVRIDLATGEQTEASVVLGPSNAFREVIASADVHGLRFARPVLHLFTFPENRGAGFHAVDSATGTIVISADDNGRQRPLLTRKAFNSSSAAVMASLVFADPAGRWFAALTHSSDGWMLFLFPRSAASGRAGH